MIENVCNKLLLSILILLILPCITYGSVDGDYHCNDTNGYDGVRCGVDIDGNGQINDCSEMLPCSRVSFGNCVKHEIPYVYRCVYSDTQYADCGSTPTGGICDDCQNLGGVVTPMYKYTCTQNSREYFSLSTCQTECGSSCLCPGGGLYNNATGKCEVINALQCPAEYYYDSNLHICVKESQCPSGVSFDPTVGRCSGEVVMLCPDGYTYNSFTRTCEKTPDCPPGGVYNPATNKCEASPTISCPSGYTYNSFTRTCERTPDCPPGGDYNRATNSCEASPTISCPSGYTYNSFTRTCEKTPDCPPGYTYNNVRDRCEVSSTPTCPSETTYNSLTGRCEANPTCPPGGTYNTLTNRCEASSTSECPSGYNWDGSVCWVSPTCPSGGSWNTALKQCQLTPGPSCPFGGTYNAARNRCELSPTCPSNGIYNAITNRCEVALSTGYLCDINYQQYGDYTTCYNACRQTSACYTSVTGVTVSGQIWAYAFINLYGQGNKLCTQYYGNRPDLGDGSCLTFYGSGSSISIQGRMWQSARWDAQPYGNQIAWVCYGCSGGEYLGSMTFTLSGSNINISGAAYRPNYLDLRTFGNRIEGYKGANNFIGSIYFNVSTSQTCPLGSYPCSGGVCTRPGNCSYNPSCPSWYSQSGSLCVSTPGCSAGALDGANGVCYYTPTFNSCPSGYTYNPTHGCLSTPTCPTGTTYNSTTGRCERTATQSCPSGYNLIGSTYNAARNRCELSPTCPSNGIYNTTTDRCEITLSTGYRCDINYQQYGDYATCYNACQQTSSCSSAGITVTGRAQKFAFIDLYGQGNKLCTHYYGNRADLGDGSCLEFYVSGSSISIQGRMWESGRWDTSPSGNILNWVCYGCGGTLGSMTFTLSGSNINISGAAYRPNYLDVQGAGNRIDVYDVNLIGSIYFTVNTSQTCPLGSYPCSGGVCTRQGNCFNNLFCPGGYSQSGSLCIGTATCLTGTLDTTNDVCYYAPISNSCPFGGVCAANAICLPTTIFNEITGRCESTPIYNCPSGGSWDNTFMVCHVSATCPSGGVLNTTTDKCETTPTYNCPSGYTYNSLTGRCQANPTCPVGGSLNLSTGTCEATPTYNCPSGYTYNSLTGNCQANATCPAGATFDQSANVCETDGVPFCPAGTTYDSLTGRCESQPLCSNEGAFNPLIGKCSANGTPECPSDYTYNPTSGKCEVAPPCTPSDWVCPVDANDPLCNNSAPILNRRYLEVDRQTNTFATTNSATTMSNYESVANSYGASPVSIQFREFIAQQYGVGPFWIQDGVLYHDAFFNTKSCYSVQDFSGRNWRPKDYRTQGCAKFPNEWEKVETACLCTKYEQKIYTRTCSPNPPYYTESLSQTLIIDSNMSSCSGNPLFCSAGLSQQGLNECNLNTEVKEGLLTCGSAQVDRIRKEIKCINSIPSIEVATEYRTVPNELFGILHWNTRKCTPCLSSQGNIVEDDVPSGPDVVIDQSKVCTNFKMMSGQDRRCRPTSLMTIFSNCCNVSGWFRSWCNQEERELKKKKQAGLCYEVGTYCSRRVRFLGICLQRKKTYCCFGSKLSRILHEQGRPQIGKGWGSPKTPDCKGFTPEEFSQLDFSSIDLSEYISEIEGKVNVNTTDISRGIQNWLQNQANPSRGGVR